MVHTVCHGAIVMRRYRLERTPDLELMVPHCIVCQRDVPDAELA